MAHFFFFFFQKKKIIINNKKDLIKAEKWGISYNTYDHWEKGGRRAEVKTSHSLKKIRE